MFCYGTHRPVRLWEIHLSAIDESDERPDSHCAAGGKYRPRWREYLLEWNGCNPASPARWHDLPAIQSISDVDLPKRCVWPAREWAREKAWGSRCHCGKNSEG